MKESDYQRNLKKKIETMFPGCMVLKNDPTYISGIPDLTILYKNKWAMLECKISSKANIQPRQPEYVKWANDNSFGSFIYPENEEEILHDLQQAFGT